jgi:hypothetical protein
LQTTTPSPTTQLLKLLKYGSFPQDGARGAGLLGSLDGHACEASGLVYVNNKARFKNIVRFSFLTDGHFKWLPTATRKDTISASKVKCLPRKYHHRNCGRYRDL